MGLWSRLFRRRPLPAEDGLPEPGSEPPPAAGDESSHTVLLPVEPFVFECESCGKVFEARRKRPACPECDSRDVSLMSE